MGMWSKRMQIFRYVVFGGDCYYATGAWGDFLFSRENVKEALADAIDKLAELDKKAASGAWIQVMDMGADGHHPAELMSLVSE